MVCCVETARGHRQHPVVQRKQAPALPSASFCWVCLFSLIRTTHSFFFLDGSPASQSASLGGLHVLTFLSVATDGISRVEAAKAHYTGA